MGLQCGETLNLLLHGLAAGDSLGSTSEFIDRADMPRLYVRRSTEGWPYRQVGGGAFRWQPGQPTDDTDMALCMLESYLKLGGFDGADVAARFLRWLQGNPPDAGTTTKKALGHVKAGVPWHEAGLMLYRENPSGAANGSLMRNGIVAGMAQTLPDVFRVTMLHGLITHYGPLCQLCCAAQSWIIWRLLQGQDPFVGDWRAPFEGEWLAWLDAADEPAISRWRAATVADLGAARSKFHDADFDPDSFNPFAVEICGAGYVLLTLQIAVWAAIWSRRDEPFRGAPSGFPAAIFERGGPYVLAWVALVGEDSDTYGATAGSILAALHRAVPKEFTEGLWILRDEMPDSAYVRRTTGLR